MAVEITRTPASNGNQKIWTWSAWVKKQTVGMGSGDYQQLFTANVGNSSRYTDIYFREDYFEVFGGVYSTSPTTVDINVSTNRVFRDPSAFYHLVVAVDTTQSTAADRVKIYVNGAQETSLKNYQGSTVVYPGQNNNTFMNVTTAQNRIGASGGSYPFKGLMSHIHFIDGTAYPASTFGETDSTSGIWKPKTAPSVTYGTNGFFLKFENSGNLDLDSSGNNHTFSTSGTLIQNVDTPSNVYTTWNNGSKRETATNGALQIHPAGDASYSYSVSTLGASKGKWYFEFKSNAGNGRALIGMVKSDYAPEQIGDNEEPGANAHSFAYRQNQGDIQMNNSTSSYGTQVTWTVDGGILMMAVDLDNNKVWYGVDGTWQNSGDPANGTNGFDWSTVRTADEPYLCLVGDDSSSAYGNTQANFGSGYFGTTAVASANSDANGHGLFEYTVPTGFYTLNTKNIKEFG